jgi:LysM repeat protein
VPLVAGAFFAVTNGGQATATNEDGASLQHVTVSSGQTLWQIAGDIAPQADPREVVADIVQLNQLGSGDIQAGQTIAIPAEYSK